MGRRMLLLTSLLCIAHVLPSQAATYYVSPSGSDSTSCTEATSRSSPKQSINAGLSCASGGDTVSLLDGTYSNQFLANTIPSGVTLKSEVPRGALLKYAESCGAVFPIEINNTNVTVDGLVTDATEVKCGFAQHIRFGGSARQVTIQNMEIRGGHNTKGGSNSMGFAHTGVGTEGVPASLTIRNNIIHDIGMDGTVDDNSLNAYAYYWGGSGVTFENNELYNIGGYAIHNYCTEGPSGCSQNTARNNCIHDTWDGVLFSAGGGSAGANEFAGNVIVNTAFTNQGMALKIGGIGWGSDGAQVHHNTIVHNHGVCIKVGGPYNPTNTTHVHHNICYRNGSDSVGLENESGTVIENNYFGDPHFMNADGSDVRLQPDSPAAGMGATLGRNCPGAPGSVTTTPGPVVPPPPPLPTPRNLRVVPR